MSNDEMNADIRNLIITGVQKEEYISTQIDVLILCMLELDEDKFEKVISNTTLRYGFETTMIKVVIPFLTKVGILWATNDINVAQEHYISNLVRRKLIVAIDSQTNNNSSEYKFLLFLPEGELHELGLLFAKYLIKSRGFKIIYLGQTVPILDLIKLKEFYQPTFLLTYFTTGYDKPSMEKYLAKLYQSFPNEEILLCGPLVQDLNTSHMKHVKKLKQVEDLLQMLVSLSNHK